MRVITWLGSNIVLIPVGLAVCAYLLRQGRGWRPVVLVVAALAGADACYEAMKPLIARERPPVAVHLTAVSGYAFPSGHATAAIALWGAVAVVLFTGRSIRWKAVGVIASGVIAILVASSRLYLGVHWWTDVVAGAALGGSWLCVVLIGDVLLKSPSRDP